MKFTEEEFYGNTQNTISEDGEMLPLNQIENKQEDLNVGWTIGLTFLKTLAVIVGTLFYLIAIMVCLVPQKAINIFESVKMNNAALFCYERVYKNEPTLANLYNIVQKSIQNKDHEKTEKYIQELQGKSDYVNFCLKVNEATLKVTNKEYVAYLGDLDGYLVSQNIFAKYSSNKKEEAKRIALLDLLNSNVYSFGFSSYIDCLVGDKTLTEQEVKNEILALANTEMEEVTVLELIKQRRVNADVSFANENLADKILRVYTSLKIEKVLLKIYDVKGEEDLKNQTAQNIQNLQAAYNNLVK